MWSWTQEGPMNKKKWKRSKVRDNNSPLSGGRQRWWRCLPLATLGLVSRMSICGWLWSRRLGLACHMAPTGMGTSKRGRRTLNNYITNGRKTALIGNNVRASLRRIITSLGRLGLGRLRQQALLHKHRKVHHLHLLLPTSGVLTSIQVPSFFLCLPLKYSRPTLLPNIRHHRFGGK